MTEGYMRKEDVLVWVEGNQPSIHDVSLLKNDYGYYFQFILRKGTSIKNYTYDERKKLKEVLNIQDKKLDFDNIETRTGNVFIVRVL